MSQDVSQLDVKQLIPHREPFLLIDRLQEYRPGVSLQAVKAVSRAEPWFQGHFPDFPVLPGVLIIESLAQTCAAFMALEAGAGGAAGDDLWVLLRTEVRNSRPVMPGSLLLLQVDYSERKGDFIDFAVRASQDGKTSVRGRLTVGRTPRSKLFPGQKPALEAASGTAESQVVETLSGKN
jgi:3-hydroxyacyl-[acyl-carrier-protein] dehydratase